MSKLITVKKSDLHVKDGWLLDANDNLIPVHGQAVIIGQFWKLVDCLEMAAYLAAQPDKSPAPSLDGFKHSSNVSKQEMAAAMILPDDWATEILEAAEDEMALKNAALDELTFTNKVREKAAGFMELYGWAGTDEFSYVDDGTKPVKGWDERMLVISAEEITAGLIEWISQAERMEPAGCCCNKQVFEV